LAVQARPPGVEEIAAALIRRNVPFAFMTDYDRANLPRAFQNRPVISKPFTATSVLDAIARISRQRQAQVSPIRSGIE
jgi:hypothetical protein